MAQRDLGGIERGWKGTLFERQAVGCQQKRGGWLVASTSGEGRQVAGKESFWKGKFLERKTFGKESFLKGKRLDRHLLGCQQRKVKCLVASK